MSKRIKELQQAGITLIALVVTIVVLLILAGVTLNLVLGENGIIGKSKLAYETQTRAVIDQEIEQSKGYAQTYKQTWTGSYLEKVQEFLSNDEVLKAIGETTVTLGSKGGENFVILSVGGIYNCKITEDGEVEWLENAEAAADALRPEIVNLQTGDVSFSFSPSTPNQGPVTVTITEKANLDKKGNTLRYKIGTGGTWTDYTAPFNVSDNCTIYAALYNGKDYGSTASGEVSNIDTTAPTSCTFTIDETTANSITVTATASDATGIKYFDFSSDGGSTYPAGNRQTIATPTSGSVNKTFTFTGLSDGTSYTLRVKATDEAGNYLQSSTQQETTESATVAISSLSTVSDISTMYGETVDYTSTIHPSIKWQLFYADSSNYYIIARDYVPNSELPCNGVTIGSTTYGNTDLQAINGIADDHYEARFCGVAYDDYVMRNGAYSAGGDSVAVASNELTSTYLKWVAYATTNGYAKNNVNMKAVAYMMDTNKWSSFADGVSGAKAMGGPTLEMLSLSWNAVRGYAAVSSYAILSSSNAGECGYRLSGSDTNSNLFGIKTNMWCIKETDKADGFWLASPSNGGGQYLMKIDYRGRLNGDLAVEGMRLQAFSFHPEVLNFSSCVATQFRYEVPRGAGDSSESV